MVPTAVHPKAHTHSNVAAPQLGWRLVVVITIAAAIFLSFYANVHPFHGQTMGQVSAKYATLLTPAAYAFRIWGLIFSSLVVYAIWQLLPLSYEQSLPDAVARPLALASVGTGAWVVLFAYEMLLPSLGVMLLILGCLITAYGRVRRRIFAGTAPVLLGVPFSLFLAWISVATVLNLIIGLRQLGWQAAEGVSVTLTLGLIVAVTGLALVISRVFRDIVFPLVVAWALAAVWVARLSAVPELGWAALAGAAVAALGGIVLSRLGGRKAAWQLRDEAAAAVEAEIAARNAARRAQ